ncbi:ATP-binding protein [Undibacterium sp. Di24W]|uniref:sensor histidine kinase n=1 Tax=Undibacterium sp. Di24W TaxID=3413033 RepID=UPI003BF5EF4D
MRWFNPFSQASFARQLGMTGVLLVFLMGTLSTLLSSWQGSRQVRIMLEQQGMGLARGLAQQSQLALLTGSAENAQEAVKHAMSFPDIVAVEIVQADGTVIVAQGQKQTPLTTLSMQNQAGPYIESNTSQYWRFVAPVFTDHAALSPFEDTQQKSEFLGYVRLTQGKNTLEEYQNRLVLMVCMVMLISSVFLLWGLRVLARNLMRPLYDLSSVMGRAGTGEVGLRAPVSGPRDIANMSKVFNVMMQSIEERELLLQQMNAELTTHAASLELRVDERTRALQKTNDELQDTLKVLQAAQHQLVENEKLVSLGRLVAGVAHELNTPLGNALMSASTLEALQGEISDAVRLGPVRKSQLLEQMEHGREASHLIRRNVERAAEIVGSFKQLAIDQTSEMRRIFFVDVVITDVLATLRPLINPTPISLETDIASNIEMDSFPGPLGQIIVNIVQNALVHGFEGRETGSLILKCKLVDQGWIQLVCQDDGNGMTKEVVDHVYDAFFTTKFGRGGSGLGMQIVHTLVTRLLGGKIQIHSAPNQGTRVEIILPVVAPDKDKH